MVESSAVMRRTRMSALPEEEESGPRASGCWPGSLPKAARRANRDLGKVEIDCQRQLRRRSRLGNLRIKRAGASEATHKENSRGGAEARRRGMVGADRRDARFLRRSLGGGRFVVGDSGLFILVGDYSTWQGLRLSEFIFSRRAVFSSYDKKLSFFVLSPNEGGFLFMLGESLPGWMGPIGHEL